MSRLTLSDMVQIQADTISRYEVLFGKVLDALTAPRQTQAAQTVKLARGATHAGRKLEAALDAPPSGPGWSVKA